MWAQMLATSACNAVVLTGTAVASCKGARVQRRTVARLLSRLWCICKASSSQRRPLATLLRRLWAAAAAAAGAVVLRSLASLSLWQSCRAMWTRSSLRCAAPKLALQGAAVLPARQVRTSSVSAAPAAPAVPAASQHECKSTQVLCLARWPGDAGVWPARRSGGGRASRVLTWLYVGGERAASAPELMRRGMGHVLNCSEQIPFSSEVTRNQHLPLRDHPGEELAAHFPEAFKFLREAKACGGRCLVHCRVGASRSVAMVLAYLITNEGMRLSDAWALVLACRPQARPNSGFARQLLDLDQAVHGPCAMLTLDMSQARSSRRSVATSSTEPSRRAARRRIQPPAASRPLLAAPQTASAASPPPPLAAAAGLAAVAAAVAAAAAAAE